MLSGGHDVPKDKIISRYERALALVGEVVAVSDICHIYDNSSDRPFRIFKKRKTENFYEENMDWKLTNIQSLTNVKAMVSKLLNIL